MIRLLLMAVLLTACSSQAQTVRDYTATCTGLQLSVDSIEYRPDVTRLYGSLIGTPHTSSRIDDIVLFTGKSSMNSTDVDGIDIKRWFQWEDDGRIPVEIDFPIMKPLKFFTVKVSTPHGEATWTIKRQSRKAGKK